MASALKELAQKAKRRLTSAGKDIAQSNQKGTRYLSDGSYAIVANRLRIEEDPLFDKVKKLLEEEDVYNPLSRLTDKKVFNTLSSVEKERYILDIAKRYNEIKEYILKNQVN